MTPYEGTSPYVFVSYAHKDSARVLPILEALSQSGFRIWYDAGIEAGTEWPENIASHLENATVVLAFLSPFSIESKNCRQEINFALNCSRDMLSIYLDEFELTRGLEMRLGLTQSLFYYRHESFESFFAELTAAKLLATCREEGAFDETPEKTASPLSDFVIEDGVLKKYIGKDEHVVIPYGVKLIGPYAFGSTSTAKSVIIPASVTKIEGAAFFKSEKLEYISIPSSVRTIISAAFQECTSLKEITLPDSVTMVGDFLFFGCENLTSVTLSKHLTAISGMMFACCEKLTHITIPEGIETVGLSAFLHCTALKEISLPASLRYIRREAFRQCASLESITIPDGVKKIEPEAFAECDKLSLAYLYHATKYAKFFSPSFPKHTKLIR